MATFADDRIRLMKFATWIAFGSSERQLVNLGLALDAGRFAVEYACMRRCGYVLTELAQRHIPLAEYPIRRPFGFGTIRHQLRLARRIGRRRIQIVHAYGFYSNVFAIPAAWIAGAPVIVASIRDRGVYLTAMQRHVQRLACRMADCVLVHADAIKDWLVGDGYDPSNIVVIRNGVDLLKSSGARQPGLRADLGIPEGVPVVGMIARLNPTNGIEDFIDAAAIVSWNLPEAVFLIVGEGDGGSRGTFAEDTAYRQTIVDRARRLGLQDKVRLTALRADVGPLLAEMSVSVLPSPMEGLSSVLLESMAAGLPVVATRAAGTPEAVVEGENGLLVPPGDPQDLATAIARLLKDPALASHLGATGRRSVRERFSMDRMVHATEQLYLDLLVRKAAKPDWRARLGLAYPPFETAAGKRS